MDYTIRGERVRALMTRAGLGPGQVAYKSGLSPAQIYRILAGERPKAQVATVAKIAQALSTTTDYLLGLTANSAPRDNPGLDEEDSRLITLFQSLNKDDKHVVITLSEWLTQRFK